MMVSGARQSGPGVDAKGLLLIADMPSLVGGYQDVGG